jgi:hypothetical protein
MWDLVPRLRRTNVITGKWIFRHKLKADGSLNRYKARWVLWGFTQCLGVDYDETFSPVVKPTTVWTVLTLPISKGWPVHQLDVKNAFLHGTLSKTVYCSQPTGFVDPAHPQLVCRLNKSLYGLSRRREHGTTASPPTWSPWASWRPSRTPHFSSTAAPIP